ncbi:MAG: septum formation initiator family protein [Deltaproteobacteria bacterium]|nr:septum formation initiator family protein [Deltaproteobacteria bacterium]MBW2045056.1 septum formation initiator family protein [Deltaproteobacteria bacterium]
MSLRKKNFLKFALLAFMLLAVLVAWLGFGKKGFIHLYRMEKERQGHLERIRKLEQENKRLMEEIKRLQKKERAAVEPLGRRELGLVKDDEVFYRFTDQKQKEKSRAKPPGKK